MQWNDMDSIRSPNMRWLTIFIVMLFISTLSFSAPLKVGVGLSGPPIAERVVTAHGPYYFGFCIDLMNKICQRIGQKCVYRGVTLKNQLELLDNGSIDLLILSKPYTSLDGKQYAISIPYAVSKIQFIALKNSPINKVEEIKDKKIGAIKSTFYDLLLQSPYHEHNQIIPYNLEGELLDALAQKKVDVIVFNNAIAYRLATNNFYDIKLIGRDLPLGDGYGIIGLSDKAALITEINKAILSIQKDGTYASIYRKYYEP
ncbi:transporter substrate-binding domain-containing protein [Legionella fallonii]|uniref:Solute-binding protein family 3/N-terminal domain-containing protein n=1 Tax=Legionella fallonii LLAP-10 TaxID=1212491 RepID=A0A098G8F8_9GAMM|nr:transporter substrate-binding domain-containing protein [Legionella fallonii]CEG58774.1 conserved exported protein of unknown function [Legionella fallonii LLAP-10]